MGDRERVTDDIAERIISGRLPPGAALDDDALAGDLGADPAIVRDALCFLQRDGFVRDDGHDGFAVKELEEVELRESYPIATLLEGLAVRSTPGFPPDAIATLREHNAAMERDAAVASAAAEHNFRFHDALVERCGNDQLLGILRPLKRMLLRYELAYMRDPAMVGVSVRRHAAIVDALAQGDAERAAAEVEANFREAMPAVLRRIRADAA